LSEYWERSDSDNLANLAHQLRGSAAGYGFPSISVAAGCLEEGLKTLSQGAKAPGISSLRDQFRSLLELCQRVAL
jgi:HPt (histidine-containing phosphotransfer) domain-containing protein